MDGGGPEVVVSFSTVGWVEVDSSLPHPMTAVDRITKKTRQRLKADNINFLLFIYPSLLQD
jgi:hypothetical protein